LILDTANLIVRTSTSGTTTLTSQTIGHPPPDYSLVNSAAYSNVEEDWLRLCSR